MGGACNFISVKNNITFNNVNFTNNFAKFGAGAIYATACTDVTLTNSYFNNNSVNPLSINGGYGGGIIADINLKISNCYFINNFVNRDGGVIYTMTGRNLTINNSRFINNSAKSYGNIFFGGSININSSIFINNFAERGGVVYSSSGFINISNSEFDNNFARGENISYGGCIYAEGYYNSINRYYKF